MNIEQFLQILFDNGILIFFLIFVLVYAILERTKILGDKENSNKLNLTISIILGLLVIVPHILGYYPPGADIVNIINAALPQVSLVLVAILMLLIMLGVFMKDVNLIGSQLGGVLAVVSVIAVLYIFAHSAGWIARWPKWLTMNAETQALVIILLVFGAVIFFITKPKKKNKGNDGLGNWLEDFSKKISN